MSHYVNSLSFLPAFNQSEVCKLFYDLCPQREVSKLFVLLCPMMPSDVPEPSGVCFP